MSVVSLAIQDDLACSEVLLRRNKMNLYYNRISRMTALSSRLIL
jgi:hypothetical protein